MSARTCQCRRDKDRENTGFVRPEILFGELLEIFPFSVFIKLTLAGVHASSCVSLLVAYSSSASL